MINKNNKNFQITLDPESANILETLAIRFKTSKSIIIRNALKVYAARKTHNIKLVYSTFLEVEQTEPKPSSKKVIEPQSNDNDMTWDELMKYHQDDDQPVDNTDLLLK